MLLDSEQTRVRLEALSRLEARLSFRISRLSKLLDNHGARLLAGSALNLTSYRILLVLDIFEETSAADLSRLMVIDRAQISRSVAGLIRRGLLAERPDPASRRRKLLRVTEQGRHELELAEPLFVARQEQHSALLTEEELRGLGAAIDRLSRHLAQEMDHPEALPLTQDATPARPARKS